MSHERPPIRTIIVEDNLEFAAELTEWLTQAPDFVLVSHYSSTAAALECLPALKPHLAVVDLKLPGLGGIEFISHARRELPGLVCVVLTQFEDSDLLFAALAAGADSYLLKHDSRERILNGLRETEAGGSVMSPSIGRKVLDFFQRRAISAEVGDLLSARQVEILRLARAAKTPKEIAHALQLSPETVRTHFRNIYRALHVHSLNQALDKAFPGS